MSKKPLVAILTGNSNSGSACIEELFSRYSDKVNVRGLFRSKEKAQPFAQKYPKLEVITDVDAYKPDTLKTAFKGVDSALIVTPHDPAKDLNKAGDDAQLTATMINEAVGAGVKYIVLVASFTVHYREHMPIIAGRFWPSEDLLEKLAKEKDVKFTVLRGGCFMENLIPGLKKSLKTQEALMMCNMVCAMVDTQDIGKSGAACLAANGEGHHSKYYEMTGPEMQNGQDLAKVLTKVFGKPIKYIEVPLEKLKNVMPLGVYQIYEYMVLKGKDAIPFNDDVKKLTGQHGTFEKFIMRHKEEIESA